MVKKYYIAYGSNLNVRQMIMRCPNARIIGTSEIPNYELLFKGSKTGSYLTIEPKSGVSVPVGIWSVNNTDEAALDRYEGFPTFYYKTELELPIKGIRTGKIRNRTAFVYIMHEDRPFGIPSRYYVETCLEGYRNFGFDKNVLFEAVKNSRRNYYEGK
ncbi:MAG: gamma-glutamylcyclotransferase family protein [Acutalibacteraceae bacterium]